MLHANEYMAAEIRSLRGRMLMLEPLVRALIARHGEQTFSEGELLAFSTIEFAPSADGQNLTVRPATKSDQKAPNTSVETCAETKTAT